MTKSSRLLNTYAAARPELTPAHIKLLRFYSAPIRLGPSVSDELVALVLHLYTEEEAEVAQHLGILRARTAAEITGPARRPEAEVEAILTRLADEKRVLLSHRSPGKPARYRLVPLMPGAFEMIMMDGKHDDWHRTFGRLYDAVYNTGYVQKLIEYPAPVARFIPVEESVRGIQELIPADRLTDMISASKYIALGTCACRQARGDAGHDCGLPRETCLALGKAAEYMISRNLMHRIEAAEALEIKRRAHESGLASLAINVDPANPNFICSCCSCCCVALRTITQFNTPGLVAPPRYLPVRAREICSRCRTCIERCPTTAHELAGEEWIFHRQRCIGCGICAAVCPQKSLRMEPVRDAPLPSKNYYRFGLRLGLGMIPGYAQHYLRRGKKLLLG